MVDQKKPLTRHTGQRSQINVGHVVLTCLPFPRINSDHSDLDTIFPFSVI